MSAAMAGQPLLDRVLGEQRGERRACALLGLPQRLAEPGHGAVEVVQPERLGTGVPVVLAPAHRGEVGAAAHQPVQHREEDRPLERDLVLALPGQVLDHGPAAGPGPRPLEHQRRAPAAPPPPHRPAPRSPPSRASRSLPPSAPAAPMGRPPRVAEAAKGGDHALADLARAPSASGDPAITPPARGFLGRSHEKRYTPCSEAKHIKEYREAVAWHDKLDLSHPRRQVRQSATFKATHTSNGRRWVNQFNSCHSLT